MIELACASLLILTTKQRLDKAMLDRIDWKEASKKNGFWIGLGMIALAICFAMRGCADSIARSDEARYKYRGGIWQNQPDDNR